VRREIARVHRGVMVCPAVSLHWACRLSYRGTPGNAASGIAARALEDEFAGATARAMLRYRLGMALTAALASLVVVVFASYNGSPALATGAVAGFGGAQAVVTLTYYAWPERSGAITLVNVSFLFGTEVRSCGVVVESYQFMRRSLFDVCFICMTCCFSARSVRGPSLCSVRALRARLGCT
jgi:hypothetical protein